MKPLTFNPQSLLYEVRPEPLSTEDWQRVHLIHDLNFIQTKLNKGPLSVRQFDYFMEMPLDILQSLVSDQAALIARRTVS